MAARFEPEYSLEFTIKLSAPKRWKHTTVNMVERVLREKAASAIGTAQGMAEGWTLHGEPVELEVSFKELTTDSL